MFSARVWNCRRVQPHPSIEIVGAVIFHVIAPVMLGTAVYLLWRTTSLEVFRWLSAIGFSGPVDVAREMSAPLRNNLPNWFLFSLPNGLWAYAFSSAILIEWAYSSRVACLAWLSIATSIGVGSELGQFAELLPGTFEITDLLFYSFGFGLPTLLLRMRS